MLQPRLVPAWRSGARCRSGVAILLATALFATTLLATGAPARAQTAAAPPAPPHAATVGEEFIYVAAGAAAGAVLLQVTMFDGLVLMSVMMGGMIGDMAYNSAHGAMQPGATQPGTTQPGTTQPGMAAK